MSQWEIRSIDGVRGELREPGGGTVRVVHATDDLAAIRADLEAAFATRGPRPSAASIRLADPAVRLAFALGTLLAHESETPGSTAPVTVSDTRKPRDSPDDALDTPDGVAAPAGGKPQRESFGCIAFDLEKQTSWYGRYDRRVEALRDRLLAHPAAPADARTRADLAVERGQQIRDANDELERLARSRGAHHSAVRERLSALAREIPWKGFLATAERKLERFATIQARARAGDTSTVAAGTAEHRIAALAPSARWTLLVDEGGAIPARIGDTISGTEGRFVGLLLPGGNELPALEPGWHAVEQPDPAAIDQVVQRVLDAPVGVLGLTLAALPGGTGDAWITGVLELVHWVCRLLPLGERDTALEVLVEQRGEWVPAPAWDAMATAVLRTLAETDPARARRLHITLRLVTKTDSPWNGYVDALAFTWTSTQPASRARLRQSGLLDRCLLQCDAPLLRAVQDCLVRGTELSPERWRAIARRPEAHQPGTFLHPLADRLREGLRRDPRQWNIHLESVRSHLDSKSVRLGELGREVAFLASCIPPDASIDPAARLAWVTAQLETANHRGATDDALDATADQLAAALFDELPSVACPADLDRAVRSTNRFDFDAATAALARWIDVPRAVPGLRHWGRVRSSLGQHSAFRGDFARALGFFDEAIAAFALLSVGGEGERLQTAVYAAIAATDDPGTVPEEARRRIDALLPRGLCDATLRTLATEDNPSSRYAHHAVVRWISRRGEVASQDGYLAARDRWAHGPGHPWAQIELHRALLLRDAGADQETLRRQLELALDAATAADGGPTMHFIALTVVAMSVALGLERPLAFDELVGALPSKLPKAPWEAFRQGLEGRWTSDARTLLGSCLPFNFG